MPIKVSINLDKIDKSLIYQGKKGKYLNLILVENRGGRNEYGDDGFVKQDLTKEQRLAGKDSDFVGNWKHLLALEQRASQNLQAKKAQAAERDDSGPLKQSAQDDEIPF